MPGEAERNQQNLDQLLPTRNGKNRQPLNDFISEISGSGFQSIHLLIFKLEISSKFQFQVKWNSVLKCDQNAIFSLKIQEKTAGYFFV